jgi:starvation-inducible outer membrane lipoprotein
MTWLLFFASATLVSACSSAPAQVQSDRPARSVTVAEVAKSPERFVNTSIRIKGSLERERARILLLAQQVAHRQLVALSRRHVSRQRNLAGAERNEGEQLTYPTALLHGVLDLPRAQP